MTSNARRFRAANVLRTHAVLREDFIAPAGASLTGPWVATSTETGGTPGLDFVDAAKTGEYAMATDATSEAQSVRLDWNDLEGIDPTKKPRISFRLKIAPAGTAFTADERVVIGLASAFNATLDTVAFNAWFRVEGASLSLLWEFDDDDAGNDDDNDTGEVVVKGQYHTFEIDLATLASTQLIFDDQVVATVDMSTLAATDLLQPIVCHQRDAGAEVNTITIDYIEVVQER